MDTEMALRGFLLFVTILCLNLKSDVLASKPLQPLRCQLELLGTVLSLVLSGTCSVALGARGDHGQLGGCCHGRDMAPLFLASSLLPVLSSSGHFFLLPAITACLSYQQPHPLFTFPPHQHCWATGEGLHQYRIGVLVLGFPKTNTTAALGARRNNCSCCRSGCIGTATYTYHVHVKDSQRLLRIHLCLSVCLIFPN